MAKSKTTKGKVPAPVVAAALKMKPPKIVFDGIDITILDFLYRGPLPALAERMLPPEATAAKRVWIMPDKNRPAPEPRPTFVDDRTLPVKVIVKGAVLEATDYENMDAFDAGHDLKTYPVSRSVTHDGVTMILCSAKPWAAGKTKPAKAPSVKPSGRSKVHLIGDLLTRPEGCTTADVLAATSWPSVSMPMQAKLAGLKLRKEKTKGQPTRYWGTK